MSSHNLVAGYIFCTRFGNKKKLDRQHSPCLVEGKRGDDQIENCPEHHARRAPSPVAAAIGAAAVRRSPAVHCAVQGSNGRAVQGEPCCLGAPAATGPAPLGLASTGDASIDAPGLLWNHPQSPSPC